MQRGSSVISQNDQMHSGFEAQRARGVNVDWFTWQVAWYEAHAAALIRALAAVESEHPVEPAEDRGDLAYNRAVTDCAHAIRALDESEGNRAPINGHHARAIAIPVPCDARNREA